MSTRLAKGGRLIDRTAPVEFSFNGKRLKGFQGDTLAAGWQTVRSRCGPSAWLSRSRAALWPIATCSAVACAGAGASGRWSGMPGSSSP